MDWRRWTGVVGFVWVLIQVAAVALFLIAGSPPEFGDAKKFTAWINTNSGLLMDDAFLTGVATLPLLAQFTGLRSIIRNAGEGWEWAAALFFGAGTVTAAVLIIGSAAEATAAFISGSGTEPTTVRAVWAATQMILTFVYFPSAAVLGIVAYAALRAGRWHGRQRANRTAVANPRRHPGVRLVRSRERRSGQRPPPHPNAPLVEGPPSLS